MQPTSLPRENNALRQESFDYHISNARPALTSQKASHKITLDLWEAFVG
jgi:hypothetical protein